MKVQASITFDWTRSGLEFMHHICTHVSIRTRNRRGAIDQMRALYPQCLLISQIYPIVQQLPASWAQMKYVCLKRERERDIKCTQKNCAISSRPFNNWVKEKRREKRSVLFLTGATTQQLSNNLSDGRRTRLLLYTFFCVREYTLYIHSCCYTALQ